MTPKVGQYHYCLRGRYFRIYRYTHVAADGSGTAASLVMDEPSFIDREEARKRVYELNGWKYTPRKQS